MQDNSEDMQEIIADAMQSSEVKSALKNAISDTVRLQMEEISKISYVERQKAVQKNAFISTEKLLYGFYALEQHLASESEYLGMAFKGTSGSVVRYQKNKVEKLTDDQILLDRRKSYERSLHDYTRIKNALEYAAGKKGFEIIKLKYMSENNYTYADIAEKLAGTDGFSINLNEKTVRKYKNKLINEIAVFLFGTDAI